MGRMKTMGFALAIAGTLAGQNVMAQSAYDEAEMLRKLDIMLMVSALRCRSGDDDFQADYNAFSARHLATMNQAGRQLRAGVASRQGERAAARYLDRISTSMANSYGQGHPWMNCAELANATRDLARSGSRVELLAAADELLASSPRRDGLVARYGE
jgi:type II secretory pathway component PulF